MNFYKKLLMVSSIILTGFAAAPQVAIGEVALEEILVTAQRREQNTLEVPVSLDLLTEQDLVGLSDVRDLFKIAPSLQFQGGVSSGGQSLAIRGVGGGGFSSSFEHSVSVVIDQIATGPSGSAFVDFWDVARIEVLNGPQGTLFGKNVTAGLINIVTNDPTEEFEGMVSASYEGEYEKVRIDGVISGPLTDNLNARLAFYSNEEGEGIVENPTHNTTENKKDSMGLRLKTAYATESFEFNMALTYEKQDGICCARVFTAIEPDSLGVFAPVALSRVQAAGLEFNQDNDITLGEGAVWDDIEAFNGAWELVWELGNGHQIKSVTGYRDWEQTDWNDVDGVDINVIDGGLTHDMQFFSEELQLLSPSGGDLEYILGLYYLNYDIEETTRLSTTASGLFGADLQDDWSTGVKVENIAAYGHVTYKFSEQWTGFIGARILREKQTVDGKRDGNFLFTGDQPFVKTSIEDSDWMGTVGLQYFPSEKTMFYGSYSRGYKSGNIDNPIGSVFFLGDFENPIVDPETVDSFELGAKFTALDSKLRMTATLFFSEFDDFQASAFDVNANSFVFQNAGVVQTSGLELGVDAFLWEGGSLSFALSYVDAKFDEFIGGPCPIPDQTAGRCTTSPQSTNLSGDSINNSPKLRYVIGGQQDFKIGASSAYIRADYAWRDKTVFDGDLDPNTGVSSYGLLSARLALMPTENIEIALWGRNLTDEYYFVRIIDAPLEPGLYSGYPGRGRQVGAEAIVRF